VSNVLVYSENSTIKARAMMLAVIQRTDTVVPELDYTALISAEVLQDPDHQKGVEGWQIQKLTIFNDTPEFHAKAR
jgi:hypothetical protein